MDTIVEHEGNGMSTALVAIVAIIAIVVVLGGALYALGYFPMKDSTANTRPIDVNVLIPNDSNK